MAIYDINGNLVPSDDAGTIVKSGIGNATTIDDVASPDYLVVYDEGNVKKINPSDLSVLQNLGEINEDVSKLSESIVEILYGQNLAKNKNVERGFISINGTFMPQGADFGWSVIRGIEVSGVTLYIDAFVGALDENRPNIACYDHFGEYLGSALSVNEDINYKNIVNLVEGTKVISFVTRTENISDTIIIGNAEPTNQKINNAEYVLGNLRTKIDLDFSFDGYINNGTFSPLSSFKTTDYIPVSSEIIAHGSFQNLSSSFYHVSCYDGSKKYIGGVVKGTGDKLVINESIKLIDGTNFIRVTTGKDYIANITLEYVLLNGSDKSEIERKITEAGNKGDLYEKQIGHFDIPTIEWVNGYVASNGKLENSSSFRRTDLIEIPSGAMFYKVKNYTLNDVLCAICFYSSDATPNSNYYVDSFRTKVDTGEHLGNIPSNARYFACSRHSENEVYEISFFFDGDITKRIVDTEKKVDEQKVFEKLYDGLGFSAFSKFASIGDSLSVGYHTRKDGTQIDKDLAHSWGTYVEKKTGAKAYWTGASGQTCKTWLETGSTTWGLNYCKTLGEMPLYVVCMGANESSSKLGTVSDIGTDADTLYAYASKVISELRKISPKSFIVCTGIARKQNTPGINEVFKTICSMNEKCYFLDCFEEFNSEPYINYFFNSHYSASGYSIMANLFDYKLKEVMAQNVEDFKYINECEA